jgi:hypothetical protein
MKNNNTTKHLDIFLRTGVVLHFNMFRVVIFEQPFLTTIMTTSFSSLSIGQKQWKEKKEERE